MGAAFAGGWVLVWDTLGSAPFAVADSLEAEFCFTAAVGLEGSFFLVTEDVVADGFLAAAAGSGRVTSFLAAAVFDVCAAVVLPVEGAVVALEAAVLAAVVVGGLEVVDVAVLDVVAAGRDAGGAVAGLVVFDMAPAAAGFVVVEVLGFGAVEATGLLEVAVVFGLTVSATGLLLGVLLAVVGLVPLVTEAAAAVVVVVLATPTGFLSGALVWFLTVEEAATAPTGLLDAVPAAEAFAAVVVFLAAAAEILFEVVTSFTVRCEVTCRDAPAVLATGWILAAVALVFALVSAANGLPLAF